MRGLCLALLLLVPARAVAQEARMLTALGLDPVVWSRWETRVPDMRQQLVQAGIRLDSGRAESDFHLVDVDADGRTDILFSGEIACYGCQIDSYRATRVYRNTGTRYVLAFAVHRPVVALVRREPPQPFVLVLGEGTSDAMCDPSEFRLLFVGVAAPPDTAFLRPLSQLSYRSGMRWPPAPLVTPLRVRVAQDSYNLRAAPVVDDTTVMWDGCDEGQRGNVITAFALGTMAVAFAQQQVGPRIWYLVVTDEGSVRTSAAAEARARGAPPLRFVGWMSSRWLETVTDSTPLPWPPGPPTPR